MCGAVHQSTVVCVRARSTAKSMTGPSSFLWPKWLQALPWLSWLSARVDPLPSEPPTLLERITRAWVTACESEVFGSYVLVTVLLCVFALLAVRDLGGTNAPSTRVRLVQVRWEPRDGTTTGKIYERKPAVGVKRVAPARTPRTSTTRSSSSPLRSISRPRTTSAAGRRARSPARIG